MNTQLDKMTSKWRQNSLLQDSVRSVWCVVWNLSNNQLRKNVKSLGSQAISSAMTLKRKTIELCAGHAKARSSSSSDTECGYCCPSIPSLLYHRQWDCKPPSDYSIWSVNQINGIAGSEKVKNREEKVWRCSVSVQRSSVSSIKNV